MGYVQEYALHFGARQKPRTVNERGRAETRHNVKRGKERNEKGQGRRRKKNQWGGGIPVWRASNPEGPNGKGEEAHSGTSRLGVGRYESIA